MYGDSIQAEFEEAVKHGEEEGFAIYLVNGDLEKWVMTFGTPSQTVGRGTPSQTVGRGTARRPRPDRGTWDVGRRLRPWDVGTKKNLRVAVVSKEGRKLRVTIIGYPSGDKLLRIIRKNL